MKKIILSLFIALCCFSLFAEESVPEWVMSAASGNLKDVAVKLGINTDENKVWIFVNERNVEEKYDLHNYLIISSFRDIESSIYQTINLTQDGNVLERKSPAGFTASISGSEKSDRTVSEFYEDPSTGLVFPIFEGNVEKTVIHGENLNNILTCLKKNSLFQEMKIECEYYVFSEKVAPKKNKKKSKNVSSPIVDRTPRMMVDHGSKPETDKKYTNCTGYMVVTIAKDLYEQKLTEAMLMIE